MYVPIHPSIHLTIYPSISISLFIYLAIHPYLSMYLSICLPAYLSPTGSISLETPQWSKTGPFIGCLPSLVSIPRFPPLPPPK